MQKVDYLERMSRGLTLLALAMAVVATIAAPVLAISWSNQPFPGFLVEETLVINDMNGDGWTGRAKGLDYPQLVIRMGGRAVSTSADYNETLRGLDVGQAISVLAQSREGQLRLYTPVALTAFPPRDLVRLFWVPYLVGVFYLAIGIWIYRAKGMARPGRALAFFCFAATLTLALFFDAATSHVASTIWMAALALVGGALISLSLRFPAEWRPIERKPWLLAISYVLAIGLAIAGFLATNAADRWAYIPVRYAIYLFAVFAIGFFLVVMVLRTRRIETATVRRQARIVLVGSILAFTPIALWFLATTLGPRFRFDISLLLPPLIVFPLAVALAIFRYRLLEVDAIVNRTILYGIVTAMLAGVITASIGLTQRLFLSVTGQKSDIAVVITTLIVVSVFETIKNRARSFVDTALKEAPDKTHELQAFSTELHAFLEASNPEQIARRLLDEAVASLEAQSGVLSLGSNGNYKPVYSVGRWRGEAWMAVPLEWAGERYGLLALGPRKDDRPYSRQECEALRDAAQQVAGAIRLADKGPAVTAGVVRTTQANAGLR